MLSEAASGQSNWYDEVMVGIVVGVVSIMAVLSIAGLVCVVARGNRRRKKDLETWRSHIQGRYMGDAEEPAVEEPADPTDLGDIRISYPQAADVAAEETPSLGSRSVAFSQELQAVSQPDQGDEDDASGYQDGMHGYQENGSYDDGHDGSDALSPSGSGRRRRSQQYSLDLLVQAGVPDQQVQQAAQARPDNPQPRLSFGKTSMENGAKPTDIWSPEFDHSKIETEWLSVDRIQERMRKGLDPLFADGSSSRPEAATGAAPGAWEGSQLQRGSYQNKQRSGGVPPGWPSNAPAPVGSVPPDIAGAPLLSAPAPVRPVPPGVVDAEWQQEQHDDEYGGEYGGGYDGQHEGIYGGEYGSEYGGKYNAQHERTYSGEYNGQHEENNGDEYGGGYGGGYDGQHEGLYGGEYSAQQEETHGGEYGGEYDVQYDGPYGAGVVIEPTPQPPQLNQDADEYHQPSWMQQPQLNGDADNSQPSVQRLSSASAPQAWPLSPAMLEAEAKAMEVTRRSSEARAVAEAEATATAVAATKAAAAVEAKAAAAAAATEKARLAAEVEAAEVARVGAQVVHYSPAAVRGSAAEQLFGKVLSPTRPPPPPVLPMQRKKTRRRLVDAEGRLSSLSNIGEAGESFARPKAEETAAYEEYSRPSSRASEDAAAEPAAEPAAKPPPPPPPPRRRRSQQSKLHRAATEPPAEEAPSLESERDESNVEAE